MHRRLRVFSRKTVYRGKIVQLEIDRIKEPGGVTADRELVVHGGSAVVLAHLDDGRLLLVRQYRYAARRWLWELVAGGIEPGESVEKAARRELKEETGYRARTLRRLFDFYPSPGFLTERMSLVEARGLTKSKAAPEPDEVLELGCFTRNELKKMVGSGKIRDGKTLVGLLWLFDASNFEARSDAWRGRRNAIFS